MLGNGVCDVVVVPVSEESFAAADARMESVLASAGASHAAAIVSPHAVSSTPRDLQATSVVLVAGAKNFVYMSPDIMSGVLVGVLLFITALIGVCCLMGLQTPDKFMAEPLPGTKEF